jgi:hypothetical protein
VNPVQGPRGRAELVFDEIPQLWEGSRLSLGTEIQNDGPRGTQGFAVARLRIPLQFWDTPKVAQLTPMERRMTAPVVRDVDIVSQAGQFSAPETATQLANGTSFSVLNSSTTTTAAALNTALTAAGASTVILSGTFNTGATSVETSFNQTVRSGSIAVRSASGRTATLTTSATITGTNNSSATGVLRVRAGSSAEGLTVIGNASNAQRIFGIVIDDTAGSATITNNTITINQSSASIGVGLTVGLNTSATVTGNNITLTGSGGATTLTAVLHSGNNTNQTLIFANNALSASGATTNRALNLVGGGGATLTVSTASTGNVATAGTCVSSGTISGSISFSGTFTSCP